MQIHNEFQVMSLSPTDSLLEVWKLSLDEWLATRHIERPVADW